MRGFVLAALLYTYILYAFDMLLSSYMYVKGLQSTAREPDPDRQGLQSSSRRLD